MNPQRKKRLLLIVALLLGASATLALALFAMKENINLFFSPTQIAQGEAPQDTRIRAGGMVAKGSVKRNEKTLDVEFVVTDFAHSVTVRYHGILPDLFREEQGVVVMGKLDEHRVMIADEVLAKHDENYMPPEVSKALKDSGKAAPQPENLP